MGFQIVKLTDPIQLTNVVGGLVPKGAYAAGTDYVVGDSVDYNGSSYVMHVDAVAGTLPTDTTKWQVLANKGDTGETATDHALLNNLSYAASGHTGFAPALGADDNYVTDAEKIVIGNTSGTNTGDNATNTQYSGLAASKQNADATLTSLAAYNTNGILTQTAADTFTGRTITGTTNQVTVTNGDGVSGNPTLSLPSAITTPGSLTITGHTSPQADSTYTLGTSSLYWSNTYTDRLYLNSTAYLDGSTAGEIKGTGIFTADNIKRGTGFPNGVVTASVGTIYVDTAITNGASSWIKKSGTGSTGWVVLEGDTGWRDIKGLINTTDFSVAGTTTSYLWIRRVNNAVFLHGRVDTVSTTTSTSKHLIPQATVASSMQGFIVSDYAPIDTYTASNGWGTPTTLIGRAAWSNSSTELAQFASGVNISIERSWSVVSTWPSTIPGTAV